MGRFLAFGEIMLRLSPPGRERIGQSSRFDIWVAGAEANVATALACLGHEVSVASALPTNDLGEAALSRLRGHGVGVDTIQRRGDRVGLCFVTPGAGMRATEVVYDRAHSSFAETPVDSWDWESLLEGVDRLHLSGITPALGPGPAAAALSAAEAATIRNVPVSFDGNWRGKLWDRWDGQPQQTLSRIVDHADILFGNHRDIALLLDKPFSGEGEDRRQEAAEAAFAAFPKLSLIASTARHVEDSDRHCLSARIDARNGYAQTEEVAVSGIVDRIGAGDAFAAGVLHALRHGGEIDDAARTGLALTILKHSLPGDVSLFGQADIDAFLAGGLDVRR